jgi:hypothetical protein
VALSVELWVLVLLSIAVALSLAAWLKLAFRLAELVLLFVTSDVVVVSSWEF